MLNRRLMVELKHIEAFNATNTGAYIEVDESNNCKFQILVIGPADSVFECVPLIFDVTLPQQYPLEPPKATFTSPRLCSYVKRIHPNLYHEGKVCLSILGTWQGPSWAASMNLETLAVSLQSLLDANPLAHEPGCDKGSKNDHDAYRNASLVQGFLLTKYMRDDARWESSVLPNLVKRVRDSLAMNSDKIAHIENCVRNIAVYHSLHGRRSISYHHGTTEIPDEYT